MGRFVEFLWWLNKQFTLCDWSFTWYSQWTNPLSDIDLIRIGISYYGENAWYRTLLRCHVTMCGIHVELACEEDSWHHYIRLRNEAQRDE